MFLISCLPDCLSSCLVSCPLAHLSASFFALPPVCLPACPCVLFFCVSAWFLPCLHSFCLATCMFASVGLFAQIPFLALMFLTSSPWMNYSFDSSSEKHDGYVMERFSSRFDFIAACCLRTPAFATLLQATMSLPVASPTPPLYPDRATVHGPMLEVFQDWWLRVRIGYFCAMRPVDYIRFMLVCQDTYALYPLVCHDAGHMPLYITCPLSDPPWARSQMRVLVVD